LRHAVLAVVAAACVVLGASAAFGQAAYIEVPGSPDAVLDPGNTGALGSTFTQNCDSLQAPSGGVAWLFVLPAPAAGAPDAIFQSVTVDFEHAGPHTASSSGTSVVVTTPSDDTLLSGVADGATTTGDGFPGEFRLAATCYNPPPPPTTAPPTTPATTVPTTSPSATSPPGTTATGGGSGGGGGGGSVLPPPKTATDVIRRAAVPPVGLPALGLGFGRSVGLAAAAAPDPTTAPPDANATSTTGNATAPTSTPIDRESLTRTKKIDGTAAAVQMSDDEPSPWPSVALGVIGAGVIVFLIMALTRRTDLRGRPRRARAH
jgi:hypothetical protein